MESSNTQPPHGLAAAPAVPLKEKTIQAPVNSEPSPTDAKPSPEEPKTEAKKAVLTEAVTVEMKKATEETNPVASTEAKVDKTKSETETKKMDEKKPEVSEKEVIAAAEKPPEEPKKVGKVVVETPVEEMNATQEIVKPDEKKVEGVAERSSKMEEDDIKHVEEEKKMASEEVKTVEEVQCEDVVVKEAVAETKVEPDKTEKEEKEGEEEEGEKKVDDDLKEGRLTKSEKKALEDFKIKVEKYIMGTSVKMEIIEPAATADCETEKTAEKEGEEEIKEDVEEKRPVDAVVVMERDVHIQPPSSSEEAVAIPDEEVKEDLHLWGVPLLHTKGDHRTEVVLLKFLRARDLNPDKAFSMLKKTIAWRKKENADKIIEEKFDSDFEKISYIHGYDLNGCPVCYNIFGAFQDKELYKKTVGDEDESVRNFLKWRVQVMEKGIQKLNFEPEGGIHSLVQIIDLKDSPGFIQTRRIAHKVFKVLQDNYPEFLAKKIVINAPWYYVALPTFAEGVLTTRQKSKVIYVRPAKVTETLFQYISPDQVPTKYGGFSRLGETEFIEGVEAPIKMETVNAETEKVIKFPSVEAGNVVVWDVTIIGWDVKYTETFVPSDGSFSKLIQKAQNLGHEHEPIRNSFKATEPGKIELTIDNSTSKKKKTLVYRYLVKSQ